MSEQPEALVRWHQVVETGADDVLAALLDQDVVFRSPAVHTPVVGRDHIAEYLRAAMVVLGPTLHYERTWTEERSAVLEFTADLDGIVVHGIDMITWNAESRIIEFTVMVRPFKGLTRLVELMGARLAAQAAERKGAAS